MAEALDMGKDPNGPTHSSTLFVRGDGNPLSFYVRPSPIKRRLSTLILHGGGTVWVQEPGAVLLAQPGEALAEASGDFISTQYILDCVERNERLELEAYRLGAALAGVRALETKPGASGEGAAESEPQPPTGRVAFTDADDVAILTYVKEHARSPSSVTGNALWKAMEKGALTQHSWQSMKDRYLKHLRGQEHKYLLGDAPRRQYVDSDGPLKQGLRLSQTPEEIAANLTVRIWLCQHSACSPLPGRTPAIRKPQNKRTPDLPEEECGKEESGENETVKKILVESTRDFEEVVVNESSDFEIHITMCDDDPPTPEDSETQPDEEEEEKLSSPEVGAAIKIIQPFPPRKRNCIVCPTIQNFHSFDPFADASKADDLLPASTEDYIHIRIQRNDRKTLTTVQGIADDYDKKKLVKAFKKKFACDGTVIEHPEYGEVIQLQGDQRKNICQFLVVIGLAKDDQLKVHGF
ncbi:Telomeric repeat-binding factor 2-interacting protein 1 [Heterocephalus glaber]|uniref:Telomeric repeat-binding factor 2-interacting protein 1 n=1 Tax=Heterocephalus glaber TaxID=10181 RepID=G5B5Y7_HETGA|nr:Telomeric repeat-binding factor 2-interacting protein 1 [Heterocephalus glaber]